jgi:hypothetical protein
MILGSIIYIGIRKYSTSLLWMLVGAVLYAAIFHLKLSVLDGSIYSFSIINDPLLYIQGVLLDVLLAFMIAAAIYGLIIITPHKPIAQATTLSFGLTVVTMLLTLLPALYYIIVNGFVIGRALPDFGLLYICMLSLVQVIIIGISGLTLTGLFAGLSTILHCRRK